jgi:23S rRNA pseudouridine1911/1915/1917 synthase
MELKIIYEDENILAIDKPAGITVFDEGVSTIDRNKTLIEYLIEQKPELKNTGKAPRFGIVHRLDKDTSGILLVAKNDKTLEFLQNQFKQRKVIKKYITLVTGVIKKNKGQIETLIGRAAGDRRKQAVFLPEEPNSKGKKEAKTDYNVLERFKNYTLLEVEPKTGKKHQIRCHMSWIHHPIAGDKLYGFKNQINPKGLKRQFLHAYYLKIKLLNNEEKELNSELSEDLKEIIKNLKENVESN